jgi:hypothetical protein
MFGESIVIDPEGCQSPGSPVEKGQSDKRPILP